ncbi:UDP-N-acetylmuramate dehydrogenase [Buchnera aphidicola]|uniref:UDP-N-acetylenolpyruvoylglucosamine reductase n=1 Tax=Buchnera aphidicola (Aphis gossypii) TaxID=98785 RepID=A0A5J6ZCM0_9GAMM|nr:UDP-N-acetylmuramate dehydrogenase [Buchnera aphidicola]QFQ31901.1 UDP-N-acetylmuramate dehydrogenase [Buchnera aphidicola (Aphis gossypii)]UPT14433.1 UDP-N-acetylmuramate dehydrogenase [Buchnera aphidicola (Aphis gossypii)]
MYKNQIYQKSLKDLNTFSIDVTAKRIIFIRTIKSLIDICQKCYSSNIPYVILGEGSNVLFLENYKGIVIINRIKGIKIKEKKHHWLLHVFSGEKWHDLVKYTLRMGFFGLENLALIPGCLGSAAIQNIGAYGLEFQNICQYVDIISLKHKKIIRIEKNLCKFSYRDSIFKHKYTQGYAVIAVGIKILKKWKPIIFDALLKNISINQINPYEIYNNICKIRKKKLPNLNKLGNAGSFFKNPIISKKDTKKILSLYVNIPHYFYINGSIKISAAWLIEKCNFNKIQIGDAAIYKKQKLILINRNTANPKEILILAKIIQKSILKKFKILLEPEIDFINSSGKIKLLKNIS